MKIEIIFFFAAILIVGAFLLIIIEITKKQTKKIDIEKYRVKWLEIQNQINRDDNQANALAILNADKLLDHCLKDLGYSGLTMAERLKGVNRKLSDKPEVWRAHKLRNQVAHEIDMQISYDQARWAIKVYKKALKELGAI